ncbi:MAG: DUF4097 family beta strand repeat-containing protein [Actinomycetota bacterium]
MQPQTFHTPGELHLELRIPAGSIEIRATETTETRLEITGDHDPDAFRIAFEERTSGGHLLTVEQRQRGRVFGWRGSELRVDVTVPSGTYVSCDTGSADLEVVGRVGSLTFRSGSGDCGFDDVDGDVTVKTASGDLRGAAAGRKLTLQSASGDVDVRTVGGGVVGRTASGDLRFGSVDGAVEATTVSGEVAIGTLAAGVTSIKTVSGDVEVGMGQGIRVFLDLSSMSGETSCDLDMGAGASGDAPADAELHVGTVSGDIRVVRATR